MPSGLFRHKVRCTAFVCVLTLLGCGDGSAWLKPRPRPAERKPAPPPLIEPVLRETVGAYARLAGAGGLRVRGFGVVIGLGENGSSDCPTAIREYLVDYFNKEFAAQQPSQRRASFSAERLISSLDSAVVEVIGVVPGGAPRGARFDVHVQTVPGTATRSLEGGLLLPCELKNYEVAAGGRAMMAGRTLARARGPVFTNPFASASETPVPADLRRGVVLGGGHNVVDRATRLILAEPSWSLTRRMARRINERFGQNPKAAEEQSQGYLALTTPRQFASQPERFLQLAPFLYLYNQPAFCARKLRELSEWVVTPEANPEQAALLWEGLGPTAVAQIRPLWGHENPAVAFYTARAGLRLKDASALPYLVQIATTLGHPHRLLAIRELGACEYPQAAHDLVPLLNDENQEVRIAAYEALAGGADILSPRRPHPAIQRHEYRCTLDPSLVSVVLDVVESNGKPLLYVRRTRQPRIAVFGPRTPVVLPMFYAHPDRWVTLNAVDETGDVTLFCQLPDGGLSDKLMVSPRVVDLIGTLADLPLRDETDRVRGIGLTYTRLIQVLSALCDTGTIPARLVLEQTSLTDILGPEAPPERPETDQPESQGQPPSTVPPEERADEPPDATASEP